MMFSEELREEAGWILARHSEHWDRVEQDGLPDDQKRLQILRRIAGVG
jgi:hypothetical protein